MGDKRDRGRDVFFFLLDVTTQVPFGKSETLNDALPRAAAVGVLSLGEGGVSPEE